MSRSDRRGLLLQSAHTSPSVAEEATSPPGGEIKEEWPVFLTLMQLNTILHGEEARAALQTSYRVTPRRSASTGCVKIAA